MAQGARGGQAHPRFGLWLMTVFAMLGLLLAAGGILAVVAYDVSQRTTEIGVRIALGAQPRDVTRLVLRDATRLIAGGVVLGLAGALVVARMARGLLFEVAPLDLTTLVAATLLLMAVGLLAAYVPTHRATRVDPVVALRAE